MKKAISTIIMTVILARAMLMCSCGDSGETSSQIKSFDDLKGKTIAAQLGTEHAVALNESRVSDEADVVYVTTTLNGISDLLAGQSRCNGR